MLADRAARLAQRGQRRMGMGCDRHIVEADQRDIAANLQAGVVERVHGAKRQLVAARQDGSWGLREAEQLGHRLVAVFLAPAGLDDQQRVDRQPGSGQSLGVAQVARLAIGQLRRQLDQADPAMAQPEQMPDRRLGGGTPIDGDERARASGRRRPGAHMGDARLAQRAGALIVNLHIQQQQAIDAASARQAEA